MTKALTSEEKEAKKIAAAEEKAVREAEKQAKKEAEEKATREAEEQAKKEAEAKAALTNAENPSPATAYTDTQEGKSEREAQADAAAKNKKADLRPADEKQAKLKAKGLQILQGYPAEQKVYVTANGFGFFKHSDARDHASTLSDDEVLTVNRE